MKKKKLKKNGIIADFKFISNSNLQNFPQEKSMLARKWPSGVDKLLTISIDE